LTGTVNTTRVPRPSLESINSFPPSDSMRRRTLSNPCRAGRSRSGAEIGRGEKPQPLSAMFRIV